MCWGHPCGLGKGRNVTEAGCGRGACRQLWVFLGAEIDVSRDGGPSLSVPTTHTRTFLQRVAVELEAKDTLWKSEFHSLLAKSSFLLGEGVRVCARACTHGHGGWRGERHVGGAMFDETCKVTPVLPGTGWHLQSSSRGVETNTWSE